MNDDRLGLLAEWKSGRFHFLLLRESRFRLDGGAMFGHVPKVVWSRAINTDSENRIPLACNVLLVRDDRGHVVLVDTGMGTKWPEKEAALYGLEGAPLARLLADSGVEASAVTDIVHTHLHFDHAGGSTQLDASGQPVPTFPKATVHVQAGEWHAARNPDPRSKPSYRPENFAPLEAAGRLRLANGDAELLPGIQVRVTPGHTLHHQSVRFDPGEGLAPIWFFGDIIPTAHHLKPHWVMGYDLYPLDVMRTRDRLLGEAESQKAICIFEHDAYTALGRLERDAKGQLKAGAV